jgi:hypothetical protein
MAKEREPERPLPPAFVTALQHIERIMADDLPRVSAGVACDRPAKRAHRRADQRRWASPEQAFGRARAMLSEGEFNSLHRAAVRFLVSSMTDSFREAWSALEHLLFLARDIRTLLADAASVSVKARLLIPQSFDPLPGFQQVIDRETAQALHAVFAFVESSSASLETSATAYALVSKWWRNTGRPFFGRFSFVTVRIRRRGGARLDGSGRANGMACFIRLVRAENGGMLPTISPSALAYFGIGAGITPPCTSADQFHELAHDWSHQLHRESRGCRTPSELPLREVCSTLNKGSHAGVHFHGPPSQDPW